MDPYRPGHRPLVLPRCPSHRRWRLCRMVVRSSKVCKLVRSRRGGWRVRRSGWDPCRRLSRRKLRLGLWKRNGGRRGRGRRIPGEKRLDEVAVDEKVRATLSRLLHCIAQSQLDSGVDGEVSLQFRHDDPRSRFSY